MNTESIIETKTQLNDKIERGDFKALSRILSEPVVNVRAKHKRGSKKTISAMNDFLKKKSQLIEKLSKKYNKN